MDLILVKFYIKIFHRALFFILFFSAGYFWLKKKNKERFLFVIGFLFLGGFVPQLFITEDTNILALYFNALLVDISGVIFAVLLFLLIKRQKF